MSKKVDPAWKYGTRMVDKVRARCNYCFKVVGSITRLKQHLAGVGKDVTSCPKVPRDVYDEIRIQLGQNIRQSAIDRGQSSDEQRNAEIEEGSHQALVLPQLRIAFKGLIGACSEEAVLAVYPICKRAPCETFEEALKDVETLQADKAIIPIENSLGGSFHGNYDLIISHQLYIVGEVKVSMNYCLLAHPNFGLQHLKRVVGHPQALAQTKTFLSNLDVEKEILHDERYYAKFILDEKQPTGVIGSCKAVESYKLRVVAAGIQDTNEKKSITRFWILARDPIVPTNDKSIKTSLVFTLKEGAKELCKALSVFATRDIILTKVECRPPRNIPLNEAHSSTRGNDECFDCLYFVDFEVSMAEPRAECALNHLKEFTTFVRILGS